MAALKNHKHEIIAQALADGKSQAIAYATAYPDSGPNARRSSAARMLARPDTGPAIDARVREILAEREAARQEAAGVAARETGITEAWVLERLRQNVDRAMQVEPVLDREGNPTGEYTYQGTVANQALALIGKHLGMFQPRPEPVAAEDDRAKWMMDRMRRCEELAIAAFTTGPRAAAEPEAAPVTISTPPANGHGNGHAAGVGGLLGRLKGH